MNEQQLLDRINLLKQQRSSQASVIDRLQIEVAELKRQLAALQPGESLDVSDASGVAVFMATPNVTRAADGRWLATDTLP